jgi:hypothetical protein
MKKLSLLSLALLGVMFISNCKKDPKGSGTPTPTETPKQRAVAIYFGGTWCPPCGAYGKPAKEQLVNALKDDVILISCQLNSSSVTDPMNCPDANSLAGGFGVSGVPTMFTGGANEIMKGVSSGTAMGSTATANAQATLALPAFANISGTATISGGTITVNTKTKFLKDQAEEYMVAAYVLEDGITATQSSDASTKKNIHDRVLRTKLSSTVFGETIGSNFKSGDSKDKTFTATLNSSWNAANLSVAIVLWRKNTDGKVTMCNGVNVKL